MVEMDEVCDFVSHDRPPYVIRRLHQPPVDPHRSGGRAAAPAAACARQTQGRDVDFCPLAEMDEIGSHQYLCLDFEPPSEARGNGVLRSAEMQGRAIAYHLARGMGSPDDLQLLTPVKDDAP